MKEEKNAKESLFKQISNNIPLISIAIIILGLIKEFIYYGRFNVPIKYFLNISELGLIISDNLLLLSPAIILLAIGLRTHTQNIELTEEQQKQEKKDVIFRIIFWTILFIIIAFFGFYFKEYYLQVIMICGLIFISLIIIPIFFIDINSPLQKTFINVFAIISLILIIIFIGSLETYTVDKGKYSGTQIYTRDTTYTSSDTSYFIGKTEKYIFIYNKFDTTTLIIPSESVTKIVMKSK